MDFVLPYDVTKMFQNSDLNLVCLFLQLEGQVVALLVQNMERLDEQVKEEADGIYNTLGKLIHTNTLVLKSLFILKRTAKMK